MMIIIIIIIIINFLLEWLSMPVVVHLLYVGSYFQSSLFAGRSFWVWNCEYLAIRFHTWKPTTERIGFSQWRHGTGIRVHLMYMKMANGQKTNDTKLFNSSTYSGTECPPKFWNRIALRKMKRTSETETRNSETDFDLDHRSVSGVRTAD